MLKILDRYIIRKFIGTFIYTILLVIAILIIFDFSEKIDDFLKRDTPVYEIIFDYYLNFIPYFVNLFSPLFIFISVVYFTSRLAQQTEIIPMLNSGMSFWRLLRPYFITAALLAAFSFLLTDVILPPANRARLDFELKYIGGGKGFYKQNIHRKTGPGDYLYFRSYNNERNVASDLVIEKFEGQVLRYRLMASSAKWDTLRQVWTLRDVVRHTFKGQNESVSSQPKLDTTLNIDYKEFKRPVADVETMSYRELDDFITEESKRGTGNMEYYYMEKYQRTSAPFAAFILTLIGVALSSKKVRGGTGGNIAIGVILSFSYILLSQISRTFAQSGIVHPALGIWLPNIFFLLIGIFLALRAQR